MYSGEHEHIARVVVARTLRRWPAGREYRDDLLQEARLVAWKSGGSWWATRRHIFRHGRYIVKGFRAQDGAELPRVLPMSDHYDPPAPEPEVTVDSAPRVAAALDAAATRFAPNPKTSPESSRLSAELYYRNKAGDGYKRLAAEYGFGAAAVRERVLRARKYLETVAVDSEA